MTISCLVLNLYNGLIILFCKLMMNIEIGETRLINLIEIEIQKSPQYMKILGDGTDEGGTTKFIGVVFIS